MELLVFGQPNLVLNLDLKSCLPNTVVTLVLYIHMGLFNAPARAVFNALLPKTSFDAWMLYCLSQDVFSKLYRG